MNNDPMRPEWKEVSPDGSIQIVYQGNSLHLPLEALYDLNANPLNVMGENHDGTLNQDTMKHLAKGSGFEEGPSR